MSWKQGGMMSIRSLKCRFKMLQRNIFIVVNQFKISMSKRGKLDPLSLALIVLLIILVIWFLVMLLRGK